jgi:hypothetical protein
LVKCPPSCWARSSPSPPAEVRHKIRNSLRRRPVPSSARRRQWYGLAALGSGLYPVRGPSSALSDYTRNGVGFMAPLFLTAGAVWLRPEKGARRVPRLRGLAVSGGFSDGGALAARPRVQRHVTCIRLPPVMVFLFSLLELRDGQPASNTCGAPPMLVTSPPVGHRAVRGFAKLTGRRPASWWKKPLCCISSSACYPPQRRPRFCGCRRF